MLLGLLVEFLLEGLHVVLNLLSLLIVYLVHVSRACLYHPLIQHPLSVQSDDALLQIFLAQTCFEDHLVQVILEMFDQ